MRLEDNIETVSCSDESGNAILRELYYRIKNKKNHEVVEKSYRVNAEKTKLSILIPCNYPRGHIRPLAQLQSKQKILDFPA